MMLVRMALVGAESGVSECAHQCSAFFNQDNRQSGVGCNLLGCKYNRIMYQSSGV